LCYRHTDGDKIVEHREMHNISGMLEISATHKGLKDRSALRPFVLTRSFFAGSQKYAAVWSGDCNSSWKHLHLNLGMLQSLCVSGMNFCGSDIPGFFGNPSPELIVRWYQTGTFFPFMRAHGHYATKRREPWQFSPEIFPFVQNAILLRYKMLAYIYTTFYLNGYKRGWPIMTPLWMTFKKDQLANNESNNAYMFGKSILIKPIITPDENSELTKFKVYLPNTEYWYSFWTGEMMPGGQEIFFDPMDLSIFPLFIKGGSIIPQYELPEKMKSTKELKNANISLIIAPNRDNEACGFLYLDDGETFEHEKGKFNIIEYKYSKGKFECNIKVKNYEKSMNCYYTISVYGIKKEPISVKIGLKETKNYKFDEKLNKLIIELKDEKITVLDNFEIIIE